MTSFSEAIVNGFGIAAKIRDQDMQQRAQELDEQYRRDTFAENRRQFDLAAKQKDRVIDLQGQELASLNDYRAKSLDQQDRLTRAAMEIDRGKLALGQREQQHRESVDARQRMDLAGKSVGRALANWTVGGTDELAQAVFAAAIADPENNKQIGLKLTGDPNMFASAKDGTPLNQVAFRNGKAIIYGVRKKADGSLEPAVMDQGRTADNSTPPLEIDATQFMQAVTGIYGSNPYFLDEVSQGLLVAGRKPQSNSVEDVGSAVADVVAQREAAEQPPAQSLGTPASPGASGSWTQPPAQTPPAALTSGEQAGANVRNYISNSTQLPRAVLGAVAETSRRATGDLLGGTVDFVRGLAGADPRASAAPPPAPAADDAPAAAPPSLGSGSAGTNPPARTPPQPKTAEQQEYENLQRAWVATRGLGASMSVGDLESGRIYGIQSESLTQKAMTQSALNNAEIEKRFAKLGERHAALLKDFLPSGSGKDKMFTEGLRAQTVRDASLLTDAVGPALLAQQPGYERTLLSSLANVASMSQGDDAYAEELRSNPELRVSTAIAAAQYGIPTNDPAFLDAVDKVAAAYRSGQGLTIDQAKQLLGAYVEDYYDENK